MFSFSPEATLANSNLAYTLSYSSVIVSKPCGIISIETTFWYGSMSLIRDTCRRMRVAMPGPLFTKVTECLTSYSTTAVILGSISFAIGGSVSRVISSLVVSSTSSSVTPSSVVLPVNSSSVVSEITSTDLVDGAEGQPVNVSDKDVITEKAKIIINIFLIKFIYHHLL
ncbi:MAG: hypothetical protein KKC53_00965 [Actinobacteria bacterium]|nr:hypothetical protein [Actinomycetota bacterium]